MLESQSTHLPIVDRVEESPVAVARTNIGASYNIVPPVTLSPFVLKTVLQLNRHEIEMNVNVAIGSLGYQRSSYLDSPVRSDSSKEHEPWTMTPSTATFSPGKI